MTRAQWVVNVREAVIAGAATAMGTPETGLSMAMSRPTGELMVRLDFSAQALRPDFIQVTVGYHYPTAAALTDAALNDAIQAAKRQMAPEYEVIGNVERITGGAIVLFIIVERNRE